MDERLEEIRQRNAANLVYQFTGRDRWMEHYRYDVNYLLERIMELEAENERLHILVEAESDVQYALRQIEELEAKNERLKQHIEQVSSDDEFIWWK